jgi:putative hydrolase of the HAD superfamily
MIGAVGCVVFDIDDTLYLERDYVRSGFLAVGEWIERGQGLAGFSERAEEEFRSGIRGKVFDHVLEYLGVPAAPALLAQAVSCFRRHRPAITLLADSRSVIESLHRRVCLAAISDGPLESQEAKVEALSLGGWLDPIVLTARLGPGLGKPHREAFEIVEASCGFRGRCCVYVADNPLKDFAGPAELGWRRVRIRRLGGEHAQEPSGPDVEVELTDLSTLERVLEEMG